MLGLLLGFASAVAYDAGYPALAIIFGLGAALWLGSFLGWACRD